MNETQDSAPRPTESPYRHLWRGAAWAILMRWGVRLIGLVSTIILARLLTPADFGIVAMASLVIGLLASLSDLGVTAMLIREQEVTREHCDTAWTLNILQKIGLVSVLLLLAEPVSRYFGEPRLVPVIQWLMVGSLIGSTTNVGMILVRKELDFARDFRFGIYRRLGVFVLTVPLALWLRSYWALIAGHIAGSLLEVVLSYRMHAYRPRFSLARSREFLRFSCSIIPLSIGTFLLNKADVVVVGGLATTTQMGIYNVASDLSAIVTREIVTPIGRGLFPGLAKLSHDMGALVAAFGHILRTVCIVSVPLGVGLWMVAEDFVAVVLGSQWEGAVPLMRWLALYGTLLSLVTVLSGHILIVTRFERYCTLLAWLRVALMIVLAVIGGNLAGVEGVAAGVSLSLVIAFPAAVYYLQRAIPVTVGHLLRLVWRPILASAFMAVVIAAVAAGGIDSPFLALPAKVAAGAVVYLVVLLVSWWLSGCPEGVEGVVVGFVNGKLAKWTTTWIHRPAER